MMMATTISDENLKRAGSGNNSEHQFSDDSSVDEKPPQKRRHLKMNEKEIIPRGYLTSHGEILQILVQSELLSCKDLGRLLLLTSKGIKETFIGAYGTSIAPQHDGAGKNSNNQVKHVSNQYSHDATEEDIIWKSILLHHYRCPKGVAMLLDGTGLSAMQCVREIALPIPKPSVPQPLQYSPNDYVIVVTINGIGNKNPIVQTIQGKNIEDFFVNGSANVDFDEPIYEESITGGCSGVRYDLNYNICII